MGCTSASGTGCAAPIAGSAISPARTPGRGRALAALLFPAAALLLGASPVEQLDVGVDHLRSAKGLIRFCLTADPDNFPGCVDDADAMTRSVPAATRAIRFDGLPPGSYAVAVIHDENGNAKLDTIAGIPREGFGFSRNPALAFGPPRFAAARFTIGTAAAMQQIRMRYIL